MTQPLIRPARHEDIPKILKLEKAAWGDRGAAAREMIEARLETFPEGTIVALSGDEVIGLLCTLLIKNYRLENTFRTWDEATGRGYIRGRHDSDGETVYGVNLSVLPTYREHNIGRMVVQYGIEHLVVGAKRPMTVLGGRMSGYHRVADRLSPEDYLEEVVKGNLKDPSINFFIGLQFRGIYYRAVRVLPDYFPDPESLNNGVLLVWDNEFLK